MFPDVPAGAWADYADTLEDGQLQLYYGVFLLKSQDDVILVDTGMGPGPHPDRGNRTGNLYEELRPHLESNVGVNNTNVGPSDSVNYVIHTHLHGDHVGWNLRYSGGMPAPNFRRARYIMSRPDYDWFTSAEGRQRYPYIDRQVMPLRRLRLQQILEEPEYVVNDEISITLAPGHTPGHQVVLINSNGQRGVVMGDVLHSIAQVSEPSWCAGVDTDKEQSAASRAPPAGRGRGGRLDHLRGPLSPRQANRQNRPRGWQARLAAPVTCPHFPSEQSVRNHCNAPHPAPTGAMPPASSRPRPGCHPNPNHDPGNARSNANDPSPQPAGTHRPGQRPVPGLRGGARRPPAGHGADCPLLRRH